MSTIQLSLGGGVLTLPAQLVADALIARLREPADGLVSASREPIIGEQMPGIGGNGVFAGNIRGDDGVTYGLILTDITIEDVEWGPTDGENPGATSDWDGLANTRALLLAGRHRAAKGISNQQAGSSAGVSELYLPAKRELQLIGANLPHLFEKSGWYWTSTQYGACHAWAVDFEHGRVHYWDRFYEFRARAVRRFTY